MATPRPIDQFSVSPDMFERQYVPRQYMPRQESPEAVARQAALYEQQINEMRMGANPLAPGAVLRGPVEYNPISAIQTPPGQRLAGQEYGPSMTLDEVRRAEISRPVRRVVPQGNQIGDMMGTFGPSPDREYRPQMQNPMQFTPQMMPRPMFMGLGGMLPFGGFGGGFGGYGQPMGGFGGFGGGFGGFGGGFGGYGQPMGGFGGYGQPMGGFGGYGQPMGGFGGFDGGFGGSFGGYGQPMGGFNVPRPQVNQPVVGISNGKGGGGINQPQMSSGGGKGGGGFSPPQPSPFGFSAAAARGLGAFFG